MVDTTIDTRRWLKNAVVTDPLDHSASVLLHTILDEATAAAPDAGALHDANGEITYAALAALSHQAARFLRNNGIRAGDRILVRVAPRRETVALLFGASRVGAIFVPVSVQATTVLWEAIRAEIAPTLSINNDDWEDVASALSTTSPSLIFTAWPRDANDIAIVFYTSGSSGHPKGVLCSHYQISFAAQAIQSHLDYQSDDVIFLCLPMSFDYGCYQLILAALARARVFMSGEALDLQSRAFENSGVTVLPAVPTLAHLLLARGARRKRPNARLRLITNTGEALSPSTQDALREAFAPESLALMYGLTECKRATIHVLTAGDRAVEHVGRPIAGTGVAIIDSRMESVAAHTVGQIAVFGPHVTDGYWAASHEDSIRFGTCSTTGTRVLYTGDKGYIDDAGHLHVIGRADGLFKSRGVRVSAEEIERAALTSPGVNHAVVVHTESSCEHTLWVSGSVSPSEVMRKMRRVLEPARMPAKCRVIEHFPQTIHGKIDRERLRAWS